MERLKRFLKDNEMTQTEFAEKVGVSQPTVWEWLNGETLPSAENLRKISIVTKLSIDKLLANAIA